MILLIYKICHLRVRISYLLIFLANKITISYYNFYKWYFENVELSWTLLRKKN